MVSEITDETFEDEVARSKVPCVILFTAGWCTYCDKLMPVMESLSERFGDRARFCVINIDEQPKLRILFAVAALPYVVYVSDGQKTPLFDEIVTEDRLEERIGYMLDGGTAPTTAPLGKMR